MADKASLRSALTLAMLGVATGVCAADELESLDADFLAYLAELEGDEDDWTIVEPPANAAAKPAAAPKADTPKATGRSTPQQPAKPARPAPAAPPAEESKR
jgi:hypothetical protein